MGRQDPFSGVDAIELRLSRVTEMLNQAVSLLNETMTEIKCEGGDDDGTTHGAADDGLGHTGSQ